MRSVFGFIRNFRIGAVLMWTAFLLFSLGSVNAWADGPASVTLTWTAPGDDGSTGTAAQYDIRYSTSTITVANWDNATQVSGEPAPHVAGTAESFTVTGLAANTTYYFAIKTADEVENWSTLSNIASITTDDMVAPAAVADLSASGGQQ